MESILTLLPWREENDALELAATLAHGEKTLRPWFKIPAGQRENVTAAADPFVVGLLFPLMERGGDLIVEGTVSRSLLANLEMYMETWRRWFPETYRVVKIRAAEEVEHAPAQRPQDFLFAFSGGVDGCYSFWRHHRKLLERRSKRIGAAAVVHGFDVPLKAMNSGAVYERKLAGARKLLDPLEVPVISITNNLRQFPSDWIHAHFSTLIASLHLFSKRFGGTLCGNSIPVTQLGVRWGQHPMIDPLLGRDGFAVVDDGAEVHRYEKMPLIYEWREAWERLQVCANTPGEHANCGRCDKCVRTMLGFELMDVPRPPAFPKELDFRLVRKITLNHELKRGYWEALHAAFVARGKGGTAMAKAVRATIRRGRRRHSMEPMKAKFVPLRNWLRKIFRGSEKSKAQLKAVSADNV